MFLTKAQLEEIRRYLATVGVRDTDMPGTESLNGSELVAIVQNGENVTVRIGDLFNKYVTDLAPWVGQGASAFDIWKITYGTSTSTPEDFLDWLQANIIVVDDYSPDPTKSKVASEDEVSRLKTAFDAFKDNNALKKTDIITNSRDIRSTDVGKVVAASIIYQMLQDIEHLKEHGVPGGSVSIYDDLDHETINEALSANMGHVLNEKIINLENLNTLVKRIYEWDGEFRTGNLGEDFKDNKTSVANAYTVWQLYQLIKGLRDDVDDILENGGGSGEGTSTVEYRIVISSPSGSNVVPPLGTLQLKATRFMYKNGVPADGGADVTSNCNWSILWGSEATAEDKAKVIIESGLVRNLSELSVSSTLGIRAGYDKAVTGSYAIVVQNSGVAPITPDVDPEAEPEIILSANHVYATGDGKFILGTNQYADSVDIKVSTNTQSGWEFNINTLPGWLNCKQTSTGLTLSFVPSSTIHEPRTAELEVRLVKVDKTAIITVEQEALTNDHSNEDIQIIDFRGGTSGTVRLDGDTVHLRVISPGPWEIIDSPSDWVDIDTTESDNYETHVTAIVDEAQANRSGRITVALKDDNTRSASYLLYQDASISDYVRVNDFWGNTHAVVNHGGDGAHRIVVFATSDWTITIDEGCRDWVEFVSETDAGKYVQTGTATGKLGQNLFISVTSNGQNPWSRRGSIIATLDGSNYKYIFPVYQPSNSEDAFIVLTEPSNVPLVGGEIAVWVEEVLTGNRVGYCMQYTNDGFPVGVSIPDMYKTTESGIAVAKGLGDIMYGIGVPGSETEGELSIPIHIHKANTTENTMYAKVYRSNNQNESSSEVGEILVDVDGDTNGVLPYNTKTVTFYVNSPVLWTKVDSQTEEIDYAVKDSSLKNGRIIGTFADSENNTGQDKSYVLVVKPAAEGALVPSTTVHFTRADKSSVQPSGGGQGGGTVTPRLDVTSSFTGFSYISGMPVTFQIQSSSRWTCNITEGSEYVEITSGYSEQDRGATSIFPRTLTIKTLSENNTGLERPIVIVFSNEDGKTVEFNDWVQRIDPTLVLSKDSVTIESVSYPMTTSSQTREQVVAVNISGGYKSWDVTAASGNHIRIADYTSSRIRFSAFSNEKADGTAYDEIATITVYDEGNNAVKTFSIPLHQDGIILDTVCSKTEFESTDSVSTGTIAVTSNTAWTAVSSNSFVTITSGSSGVGNDTIEFSVSDNDALGSLERTAIITVAPTNANYSSFTNNITITQEGVDVTPVTPELEIVGDDEAEVLASGGSGIITLQTNIEWSAVASDNAVQITPDGNTLIYSVDANESSDEQEYTITFSGTGVSDVVFTITQLGAGAYLSLSEYSRTVEYPAATRSIVVHTNVLWGASVSSNGISIDHVDGNTIYYYYENNVGTTSLTKTITVSATDPNLGLTPKTFTLTQNGISIPDVGFLPIPSASQESDGRPAFVVTGVTDPGSGDGLVASFYSAIKIALPSNTSLPTDYTITVVEKITGVSSGVQTSSVTRETLVPVGGVNGLSGVIKGEWSAFAPISCDTPGDLLYSATVQFGSSTPYYTDFTTIAPVGKGGYEDPISMSDIKTNFGATYVGGID